MSSASDTIQSSLTTPTPVESSAHLQRSPPRGRKSPPPPKLSLDDCKPAFSTTTTNTSNNAASRPSTAFVFTSSRTLRNLHNYSNSTEDASGQYSVPDSPSSNGSVSPGGKPRTSTRPTLSHAQLARHSMGAIDARCIVSPNMRAAGFVPLPHSPVHQSSSLSGPSTPIHSPVPTPVDPPRFPPIVFFNPANVTSTSLWDYQRHLQYGLPTGPKIPAASSQEGMKRRSARPGINPLPSVELSASASTLTSGTTSYSSLFSHVPSSRSSMTSVCLSDVVSPDGGDYSRQGSSVHETSVDGFPFPATPPRSRTHSHEVFTLAHAQKGAEPLTVSPSISSSTVSGSITPLAPSPVLPEDSLPRSSSESPSGFETASSGSGSLSPEPSRSSSRPARRTARRDKSSLSITELCQTSPRAWFIDNLMLPQSAAQSTPSRDRDRSASRATADVEASPEARRQESKSAASPRLENAGAVQAHGEAAGNATEAQEAHVRAGSSKKLGLDVAEDDIGKEKKREKHRGREKDREADKEKERERRRRQKEKAKKPKRHSSSSPTASPPSSPASTTPSPGRSSKTKDRTRASARELSRAMKEKAPAPSQYSSFMFPPRYDRAGPAHTLGSPDPLLQHERARDDAEFAKDAVLAHRERDRMQARQHGERDRRTLHRSRVATAPTDAYTSTYDRGRGRGLGRGERGGLRGRGASSSAHSFLSEGETMVHDELEDAAEQVVEPVQA